MLSSRMAWETYLDVMSPVLQHRRILQLSIKHISSSRWKMWKHQEQQKSSSSHEKWLNRLSSSTNRIMSSVSPTHLLLVPMENLLCHHDWKESTQQEMENSHVIMMISMEQQCQTHSQSNGWRCLSNKMQLIDHCDQSEFNEIRRRFGDVWGEFVISFDFQLNLIIGE